MLKICYIIVKSLSEKLIEIYHSKMKKKSGIFLGYNILIIRVFLDISHEQNHILNMIAAA